MSALETFHRSGCPLFGVAHELASCPCWHVQQKRLATFRRAMRRHERRARRMGLDATGEHLRELRADPHPDHGRDVRDMAVFLREGGGLGPRIAFFYERAADAQADPGDLPVAGCGDHGCAVATATGMGTNGGCLCNERMLRRALGYFKRLAAFRQETIRTMRADMPREEGAS